MEAIDRLARAARRRLTPCGEGALCWREWGRGPALVLIHGGFGSWLHWVRNIDALASRFRVLAVDLPGLGDSAPPPQPVSPQGIAAVVGDGLGSDLLDGGRCHLVGFSFGGLIAGHVAAALGARAATLTLVGASGLGLARRRIELVRRTPQMSPGELRAAQLHNLGALLLHDRSRIDELARAVQAHNDAHGRLRSRRMSMSDSLRRALPRVTAELKGIWGEHDVTATPWLHEREALLRQLHPEVDFRVIADAGHWVQYEAWAAFNATLVDMLAGDDGHDRPG